MKRLHPDRARPFALRILWIAAFLVAAAMPAWTATAAAAQAVAQADDAPQGVYPLNTHGEVLLGLERIVSLDLEEVPLERALQRLARQGDLGLSYNPDHLPADRTVSLHVEEASVAEVLRALIDGTGLQAYVSPRKEIVLVPRDEAGTDTSQERLQLEQVETQGLVQLAVQRVITGTVTDAETGDPLPGANVVVEGMQVGTAADADGAYSLDVPDDAETLVFSSVGYVTQRIPIGGRSTIDVALEADVAALDEVVVVGYGTQRRADVTGAVSSIQAEDLQDLPATSLEEAVQGRLPGVQVAEPSGEPGASPTIRIRGTGSITAGNDPLYVIDGLPISRNADLQGSLFRRRDAFRPPSANPLAALNPNDVASIEVLKDASAAAIYGSRGSNGVVLISTKSGQRDGTPTIQFSSYVGVQEAANVPDLMSAEELIDYTRDARNNNYLQNYDPLNPDSPGYNPAYDPTTNAGRPDDDFVLLPDKYVSWDGTDTDWLDLVLSPAAMASTNLSVAGGREGIGYYLSGGYTNQDGIIEGSGFRRYTLRANVDADPFERARVGASLNLSLARQDRLPAGSPYFARPPGIIYSAMVHSPVIAPRNADGTPNQLDGQSYLGGGTTTASNPLAIMGAIEEELDDHRTFGNVYAEVDVLESLSARVNFGADLVDYTRSFYRGNSLLYRTAREGEPYAQSSSSRSLNWLVENTLTYDRPGEVHAFTGLLGFTAQRERNDLNQVIAQNFPDDEVTTINGGQVTGGTSFVEEWSLLSYLGRVNYQYRSKYLLTATLRADQSSRFGANNRTGVFPSVSLGWRMDQESFMDDVDVLNEIKWRVSYGVTGNFLIPNYGSINLLGKENYNLAGNVVTGTVPLTLGDEDLTWESTRQIDVGLDVGLLDDRLYFTADYYVSRTSDLLLNVTLPSALGYESVLTNIGEVENRGFEFSGTSRNLVGAFEWTTSLNVSTNRNEVLALGASGDPILSVGGAGIRHITQVGSEIGSYYGYVVDGVYQSQEEIDSAPEDVLAPDPQPGDFRFRDVNGDGVVNADDRTVTGSYQPDYTFGITNRFSYKGLDLSLLVQGVQGREILNLTARHLKNGEANFNSYAVLNDRWRSPEQPGDGRTPRADRQSGIHGNNNRPSSYQIEDGSYVRLRSVTLGYTLPTSLFGEAFRDARLYVTGKNLFTATDYIGFNPEVNNQAQSGLTPGEDYGAYPLARTYTVGLNVTF